MRLILEKDEIVAILGKHFDTELDPTKVIIRTDPFEIEVCGLPLGSGDAPPPKESNVVPLPKALKREPTRDEKEEAVKLRADEDATTEDPEPGNDGMGGDAAAIHPAAVLAASKALEAQLDRENPKLARRSGRWSEIAPTSSKDEI